MRSDARQRVRQRRRMEQLVGADMDELVPRPFMLEGFIANIATERGRPIQLVEWEMTSSAAPCGLWISTTAQDYVFVDRAANGLLRRQTVFHELAHMILRHEGGPSLQVDDMLEQLHIAAVARVLGRSSYNNPEEHDAELFATVLGDRVDRGLYDQAPDPGASTSDKQVITRFASAFGDARRWPRADRHQPRR